MIEAGQTQLNGEQDSILSGEAEILGREFSHILDTPAIQSLLESFTRLTGLAITILDLKGNILATSGWQVICRQFHRATPQAAKNCEESDFSLAQQARPGEYVAYKCKNNLWEIVTPLYVEGRHVANIYCGQFFYDADVVDEEFFANQAKQYGFDPEKYLAALHLVPRFSRDKINSSMDFLVRLADLISQLSEGNLKLVRTLVDLAPEAILVYDVDLNRFVDANRKAEELFGYRREDLLKYGLEKFYSLPQPNGHSVDSSIREHTQRALDGEELVFERAIHTPEGKDLCCEVRVVRLPSGDHRRLRASFIDITERKRTQEAMAKAKQRLETASLAGGVALWEWDIATNRLEWSEVVYLMLGYKSGDFPQTIQAREESIHPDDRPRVNSLITAHLKTGAAYDVEYRMRKADGTYVWWHDTGTAQRDPTGKAVIMSGACIDITEKKRSEAALRESEDRFRRIMEQSPFSVLVISPEGNVIWLNNAFLQLWGVTKEAMANYNILQDPQMEKLGLMPIVRRAFAGERVTTPAVDYDPKAAIGTGNRRIAQGDFYPIRDEEGIIRNVILIHRDITDRKRAEEAFRREKLFSDTIIKSLPGIFYVVNREGRFIRWNRAVEDLLEVTSDQLSHMTVLETFHEADRELVANKMMELFEKGHAETEARSIAKGSPYFYFSAAGMDVENESYIVGTALNIADRKRAEEEVRKLNEELELRVAERTAQLVAANKELEAFSYSVSHDLRSPLRSIDGFSHLIEEDYLDQLDDRGKDYLSRVRNGCRRMTQLIDDLLNLSRITRSGIKRRPVDLNVLALEIAAALRNTEPDRPVEFVIADNLKVNADENLLRIALENLFTNAWKFTKGRKPAKIELGITQREKAPVYFIRDNGVGFEMAYANKLFKPFQRLHSADEFPGTGIGLATVQRIILRHGGQVWAEGEVNQGATIFFTLA